eukprot:1785054-Amphidinium_carterae.1
MSKTLPRQVWAHLPPLPSKKKRRGLAGTQCYHCRDNSAEISNFIHNTSEPTLTMMMAMTTTSPRKQTLLRMPLQRTSSWVGETSRLENADDQEPNDYSTALM